MFVYCDVDGDGQINYDEFFNFFNWKDKMLFGELKSIIIGVQKDEIVEGEVKVIMYVLRF